MKKQVRVILIGQAREVFQRLYKTTKEQIISGKLNSKEMQLIKSINQKIEMIKSNPFYGDNIPKKYIPASYGAQNLWRVELINFWRMLYTVKGDKVEIICFVLDILDHAEYNKKFGYRKR